MWTIMSRDQVGVPKVQIEPYVDSGMAYLIVNYTALWVVSEYEVSGYEARRKRWVRDQNTSNLEPTRPNRNEIRIPIEFWLIEAKIGPWWSATPI